MPKRNIWIDLFGWAFLIPSTYKTIFITKYLKPPYLESIDYGLYPALYQKISITAKVWIIPFMGAVTSPIFILIGMGIIFRQKWARLLLVIICSLELLFAAIIFIIGALFNPVWLMKNFGAPYHDELLWYVAIPALCIFVFTRPRIKRKFK